jgi:hypothetical protein
MLPMPRIVRPDPYRFRVLGIWFPRWTGYLAIH